MRNLYCLIGQLTTFLSIVLMTSILSGKVASGGTPQASLSVHFKPQIGALDVNLPSKFIQTFESTGIEYAPLKTLEDVEGWHRKVDSSGMGIKLLLTSLKNMGTIQLSQAKEFKQILTESRAGIVTSDDPVQDEILGSSLFASFFIDPANAPFLAVARISTAARRIFLQSSSAQLDSVKLNDHISYDKASFSLNVRGKTPHLPPKVRLLFEYLLENKERVLTRNQILDKVWGMDFFGDPKTVDVHINWLRKAIEEDFRNPKLIITVRGIGYKLLP